MSKLEQFRKNNNFSCQDMADKLNISKSFYWQIEKGKTKEDYINALKAVE